MKRGDGGDEGGTPTAAHLRPRSDRCAQRYAASPSLHLYQDKFDLGGSIL